MHKLVDFHSHFFSRAYFEALAHASPLGDDPEDLVERVASTAGIELPDRDPLRHLERWLAELDRYGVGHLVSFASVPEEIPVLADVLQHARGRLSAFFVVDPTRKDAPARAREVLQGMGFRGVVLFPALHGFPLDGPAARALFSVVDEERAIAVVHCGLLRVPLRDRFRLPRPPFPKLGNPLDLVAAANAFPRARFVIPHFGGGLLRETLMAGSLCENLLVDTSSSNGWMATQPVGMSLADVFERALGVFGPERLLFGTDSSVFPRGWRQDLFGAQREALGACGIGEAARKRVMAENAAELLGSTG